MITGGLLRVLNYDWGPLEVLKLKIKETNKKRFRLVSIIIIHITYVGHHVCPSKLVKTRY